MYIADPNTYVLTHTVPEAVGITTREGESLENFQNTILAAKELTNLGIMKSPGTGNMVISMYCPIYDGQECIGYAGAAVYADQLMNALLDLELKSLPKSSYVFMNAETGVYLYHEEESLLNTEIQDEGHLEIIKRVQQEKSTGSEAYTYRNEKGKKQLAVYKYLDKRTYFDGNRMFRHRGVYYTDDIIDFKKNRKRINDRGIRDLRFERTESFGR